MSEDTEKSAPKRASRRRMAPARTPEAEEQQMIGLAMKQARDQLEKGTASSQVLTHFLKLGTQQAILEREKLAAETEMARAKAEAYRAQQESGAKYEEVLAALKSYGLGTGVFGNTIDEEDDYYDE